ncbi:cobalamin-binding protein [Aliiglaciecola sp. CAU 1673]|uniref:cobalamin-binding protein n=1 Tax=Aliiglaciecola sp. CAU 1673 TaxID=3032595 RepID=UPI0023DA3E53|nr:cobalamin-binding protein [Aliiglaciecola sp. CAU 1673]MDF2178507.1 cobalamin-binding protein [Aliiglaciecola sp. CAU 1673]
MRGLLLCFGLLPGLLWANPLRLISLAPHTTELVYSLDAGDQLLAVSAHSDYPQEAQSLPQVADYQGVNFEAIMRLKPDLILAWQGGNKPQDLQRLASLGFEIFYSNPNRPLDIADEVIALGKLLDKEALAQQLATAFKQQLNDIAADYRAVPSRKVFYYMWPKPLMSIGPGAWANHLLSLCNANNIFADAPNDYPEVTFEAVIARRPQTLIAANKQPLNQQKQMWQPWLASLTLSEADVVQVNPDNLHRFSLRLPDGVQQLCEGIHRSSTISMQ